MIERLLALEEVMGIVKAHGDKLDLLIELECLIEIEKAKINDGFAMMSKEERLQRLEELEER